MAAVIATTITTPQAQSNVDIQYRKSEKVLVLIENDEVAYTKILFYTQRSVTGLQS
jgi:hypothetical protein